MADPKKSGFSWRSMFGWMLVMVALMLTWNILRSGSTAPTEVSYTEFLQALKSDTVKAVEVNGEKTEAKYSITDAKGKKTNYKVVLLNSSTDPESDYVAVASKHGVKLTAKPFTRGFMDAFMSFLPLLFIGLVIFWFIAQRKAMGGGVGGIDPFSRGKGKPAPVKEDQIKVTFADVAGCDEAKAELQEIVEFLKNPQKFTRLGGQFPKGAILIGPPGVGKTLIARAIAGEAHVPFFKISGSDFVEMFVGVGASRVRTLFNEAKKVAPSIIFIDEIDAVGRHRGAGVGGGNDEREQTLNALLVEMDGFEKNHTPVIVVAATNRPDILDPALLRPGRFDRRVTLDRPDMKGREEILKVHTRGTPLAEDVDLRKIAASLPGANGADLANIVNEAALSAAVQGKKAVDSESLYSAKNKVQMGTERRSLVMSDKEKQLTAHHEGGHTLVALLTPGSDPIDRVTIIPRGESLGMTMSTPLDDRRMYPKSYIMAFLAQAMGGRIAEEMLAGSDGITTGAGDDSMKATGYIRQMVCRWGMSKLGLMTYADNSYNRYLEDPSSNVGHWSDETQRNIDAEVKRIFDERYEYAKNLLQSNQIALEAIAKALLEKETLTGDEIRAIPEVAEAIARANQAQS
ncbi:MAG: ATP-dependent zinc metalloprotease FtsH [bacterium]|nr:ATP-dependent zinc metalloprotease FtsH [bacterium]